MPEQDEKQPTQQIIEELRLLEERDYRLWTVAVLAALVVAGTVGSVFVPRITATSMEPRFVPPLIYILVSLILILNVFVIVQRRSLRTIRANLVRQLMRADVAERDAVTDPLTGLFNRRYLDRVLAIEEKRVDRTEQILSLMLVDMNDFGRVNKELGHSAGDQLLRDFAAVVMGVFRQTDTMVRYGGDEFLILMPDTDLDQAQIARKRLERAVEERNSEKLEDPPIGYAAGVAELRKGGQIQEVLAQADERMREVKVARRRQAEAV